MYTIQCGRRPDRPVIATFEAVSYTASSLLPSARFWVLAEKPEEKFYIGNYNPRWWRDKSSMLKDTKNLSIEDRNAWEALP